MPVAITSLLDLAGRQHGVVSTRQLHGLGLTGDAIRHRVRTGLLTRIHRGVYAVGNSALPMHGRMAAALLACGPGSILSHGSAAVLWRLLDHLRGPIDVSTPHRRARRRPGIRTHQSRAIVEADRRRREGLPVTSPSLTILDLAAVDAGLAATALNEALLHRLTSQNEMSTLLGRRNGHAGIGVMRRLLAPGTDDFSRQEAEKALLRLIRKADLPAPRRNLRIHGHELDFCWPELRLNVEVDGYRWHSTRQRLNRDRERDAELTTRGIRVLRLSYDQLRRPERTIAHLAAAIAIARTSR